MRKTLLLAVLIGLSMTAAACSSTLLGQCQTAEMVYKPAQIGIEAAVTRPEMQDASHAAAKAGLKATDKATMAALDSCEAAAAQGDAVGVKAATETIAAGTSDANTKLNATADGGGK